MKKRVAFCPADNNNLKFFNQLEKSLRKFHSEEQLPLLRFDNPSNDPLFWYRATPILARELLKEYETVIKLDADQIICSDISDIWNKTDYFDVGVVMNDPTYPISLWDISGGINALDRYYNNGLVVLRSKEFVEHWYRLCFSRHFDNYQFREQDLLNLLCSDYFNYKVKWLEEKDFYGEQAKPYWAKCRLEENRIIFDNHELKVIHFGGGNAPNKGNYRIRFQPKIVKRIEWLIK